VHDCIYTRRPVKLAEFRSGIQAFGEFFRLSHEQHRSWNWQDPVDKNDPFYDSREAWVEKKNRRYQAQASEGFYTGTGHDGTLE
jgi:hypothetical protein